MRTRRPLSVMMVIVTLMVFMPVIMSVIVGMGMIMGVVVTLVVAMLLALDPGFALAAAADGTHGYSTSSSLMRISSPPVTWIW